MFKGRVLIATFVATLVIGDVALAQPRPGGPPGGPAMAQPGPPGPQGPHGPQGQPHGGFPGAARGSTPGQFYYNGRWVGPDEWARHNDERDRWTANYQRRRGYRSHDDGSALIAGIIGFALGAAIVGSQEQAEHARSADQHWDAYCARKYRSYDRYSRTYLGRDGLRHYCE